jgi:hypothetical protein
MRLFPRNFQENSTSAGKSAKNSVFLPKQIRASLTGESPAQNPGGFPIYD